MKRIATVCIALGLVGCASTPSDFRDMRASTTPPESSSEMMADYRASDFAWSTQIGTNTVLGQVGRHGKDGDEWSCVGQSAALTPETRYSIERIRFLYGSAEQAVANVAGVRARNAANPGADYGQFVRSATCDARNAFAFKDLPDGSYFLIVRARPGAEDADQTAAVIMQRVEVKGGAVRHVILPEQPRP